MSDSRVTVLVTGVGGGGLGHEVVKALRLAGRYRLIGVDVSPTSFGLFDVDEAYTVPPASHSEYVDLVLDLCERRGARVIIHGSDPELKALSPHRERFSVKSVIPLFNSPEVIATGMDKSATMNFLDAHGFSRPKSLMIETTDAVPSAFGLPAIVKPATGGGGSSDTFIVQEYDELVFVCNYLLRQGRSVLLQEYVGTPEDEYTVGVLHTLDGAFVGSIALRRSILAGLSNRIKAPNRTTRSDLGPILAVSSGISQGVIDDFPLVRQQCEAVAAAIGSRGPMNIQCRVANGIVYPFEINPRFSGTTHLRALAGYNEPDLLIRHHVFGEELPLPTQYVTGAIVRGLAERRAVDLAPVQAWRLRS